MESLLIARSDLRMSSRDQETFLRTISELNEQISSELFSMTQDTALNVT